MLPNPKTYFPLYRKGGTLRSLTSAKPIPSTSIRRAVKEVCGHKNTHKGLFHYTRLPYGISIVSGPGKLQWVLENLFQGLSCVTVYLDDILIARATEAEHLAKLEEVLRRLDLAGFQAKCDRCRFMIPSVTYLGHQIYAEGLRKFAEKVKAITEAPQLKNMRELKSYLGLLTYYSKLLPNSLTVLAPLYQVFCCGASWRRGIKQCQSFQASKDWLTPYI